MTSNMLTVNIYVSMCKLDFLFQLWYGRNWLDSFIQ